MNIRISGVLALSAGLLLTGLSPLAADTVFKDGFDKPFLDEGWESLNDSSDMRAIDAGRLAVVSQIGQLSKGTAKNVLLLRNPLKEKNADIDLALQVDIQRYGDSWNKRTLGGIALFNSKNDYLILHIVNFRGAYKSDSGPRVFFAKRQGGNGRKTVSQQLGKMKIGVSAFKLRIEKRGYKYTARASTDGGKKWIRIATFAVFNKPLRPGLFAVRGKEADEAIYEFDEFAITTPADGGPK